MKVEDLMSYPLFDDFEIIAGHKGIDREITTVSVMDAPDIYKWMKGGEFLITTGYIMKENPLDFKNLIINLDKMGASALGIKLKRFIDKLPQEVIDIADRLNFPIVFIPLKYSFVDVINPVLSEIINKQARTLLYSQKIHNSFTELVIDGGSIEKIIKTLTKIINKNIIYYDIYFGKIYGAADIDVDIDNVLNNYTYYPIKIDNIKYGYIIIYDEQKIIAEYDEIAIEHASTVLKLEIQKKISNIQIESRYRHEFIQDLIMDNVKSLQEIINRAKVYDWDFEKGNVVAIFDIDNFKGQYLNLNKENRIELEIIKENIFLYIRKIIKNKFKDAVYTNFSDSIIFILKPVENDLDNFNVKFKEVSTMIKKEILQKYKFSITIGVGSYKLSPTDINISYNQAKKSIQIARNIYRKNATMFYEDLGIYKLFDKLSSETEKIDFYKSYIGKLLEYDQENNTNFLNTLKCLYENDWNLKVTAKQMYIHYNTMKYRFNKIMEILKLDLKNSEDKLNVSVALKLLDMAK